MSKTKPKSSTKNAFISMSGFGSGSARDKSHMVSVDLRSVNSRFFDCGIRMPPGLAGQWETDIKERLEKSLQRGRIEVFVTVKITDSPKATIAFDESLFVAAFKKLKRSAAAGFLDDARLAELLLSRKEIFDVARMGASEATGNSGALIIDPKLLYQSLSAAEKQLVTMRDREGARLALDLKARLTELESVRSKIAQLVAGQSLKSKSELEAKLKNLVNDEKVDRQRLEQEVALLASRADVHEELVRLASHIEEFTRLMTQSATGKRLEFLTQEFLRELNTIGSKAGLAAAQHAVVEGKGIVERMREQVQNVA